MPILKFGFPLVERNLSAINLVSKPLDGQLGIIRWTPKNGDEHHRRCPRPGPLTSATARCLRLAYDTGPKAFLLKSFSMDSPAYASKKAFDEPRDSGGTIHDIDAIESLATVYVGCVVQRKTAESCRQPGTVECRNDDTRLPRRLVVCHALSNS